LNVNNLTERLFIGNIIEIGDEVDDCPEDFPKRECAGGAGGGLGGSLGGSIGGAISGSIGGSSAFASVMKNMSGASNLSSIVSNAGGLGGIQKIVSNVKAVVGDRIDSYVGGIASKLKNQLGGAVIDTVGGVLNSVGGVVNNVSGVVNNVSGAINDVSGAINSVVSLASKIGDVNNVLNNVSKGVVNQILNYSASTSSSTNSNYHTSTATATTATATSSLYSGSYASMANSNYHTSTATPTPDSDPATVSYASLATSTNSTSLTTSTSSQDVISDFDFLSTTSNNSILTISELEDIQTIPSSGINPITNYSGGIIDILLTSKHEFMLKLGFQQFIDDIFELLSVSKYFDMIVFNAGGRSGILKILYNVYSEIGKNNLDLRIPDIADKLKSQLEGVLYDVRGNEDQQFSNINLLLYNIYSNVNSVTNYSAGLVDIVLTSKSKFNLKLKIGENNQVDIIKLLSNYDNFDDILLNVQGVDGILKIVSNVHDIVGDFNIDYYNYKLVDKLVNQLEGALNDIKNHN
jgi:hypothetical protein